VLGMESLCNVRKKNEAVLDGSVDDDFGGGMV
jgi:hypothetical protein